MPFSLRKCDIPRRKLFFGQRILHLESLMKQSVIIDIGSSKVLAMVVCPAADGAIIVQNAEERTYSGYRFGELPNAAALSDTLESIASALRSSHGIRLRSAVWQRARRR